MGGVCAAYRDGGNLCDAGADGWVGTGEIVVAEVTVGVQVSGEDDVNVVGSRFDAGKTVRTIQADGGGTEHIGDLIHTLGGCSHSLFLFLGLRLCGLATLGSGRSHVVHDALHHVLAGVVGHGGLEQDSGKTHGAIGVVAVDVAANSGSYDVGCLLCGQAERRKKDGDKGASEEAHRIGLEGGICWTHPI